MTVVEQRPITKAVLIGACLRPLMRGSEFLARASTSLGDCSEPFSWVSTPNVKRGPPGFLPVSRSSDFPRTGVAVVIALRSALVAVFMALKPHVPKGSASSPSPTAWYRAGSYRKQCVREPNIDPLAKPSKLAMTMASHLVLSQDAERAFPQLVAGEPYLIFDRGG
jgi:hypothetical protein